MDSHLGVLGQIAAIARQFGPRLGNFPMVTEYANSDNYLLDDTAIWCADGPSLEADSAAFRRPGSHRQHPLYLVALRLHTVDSARDRYRRWAEAQWESQHVGPQQSWVDEHGVAHEMPKPTNPYRQKADAR